MWRGQSVEFYIELDGVTQSTPSQRPVMRSGRHSSKHLLSTINCCRITVLIALVISKLTLAKIGTKHRMKDSEIFTIKIPAEPYKFKEGLGFVSENNLGRADILSALKGFKSDKNSNKQQSKIFEIPTKFFANGKLSVTTKSTVSEQTGTSATSSTSTSTPSSTSSTISPSPSITSPSTTSSPTSMPESGETTVPTSQPVMESPGPTQPPAETSTGAETVEQISAPVVQFDHRPFLVPASTRLLRPTSSFSQGGWRRPALPYYYTSPPRLQQHQFLAFNPYQILWRPVHNYFYG